MKTLFTFYCISFSFFLTAQPYYGAKWVLGNDSGATPFYDGTLMDFLKLSSEKKPNTTLIKNCMDFASNMATINDSKGNLVAYTNGCFIANKNFKAMKNGTQINAGYTYDGYCKGLDPSGYPSAQGTLFLPDPKDTTIYHLFHVLKKYNPTKPFPYFSGAILQTTLDKKLDNNAGAVTQKDVVLLEDTLNNVGLSATKHGNGRDWWILMPQNNTNGFYKLLLTRNGVEPTTLQKIGPPRGTYGQSTFSTNGQYYARAGSFSQLQVFNFDRCSSELSNERTSVFCNPNFTYFSGIAFSPNSRFLYVTTSDSLFQFDMDAPNLDKSKILIDTFYSIKPPVQIGFGMMRLGINNKIYIAGFNQGVLHTIHAPDSLGKACRFKQSDIKLPSNMFSGLPNMPNYALGALKGSPCDTLLSSNTEITDNIPFLKLSPNPASSFISIQLSNNESIEVGSLKICDLLGKNIYEQKIDFQGNKSIEINTSNWKAGTYYCTYVLKDKILAREKLVIIR
jgi:hypothetical protein